MRVGQVATPAAIWAHPTRTLTNPAAASDLANMLVGISGTATGRAAYLDVAISSRQAALTWERYADTSVLPGAAYTPTASGMFVIADSSAVLAVEPELYSAAQAAWYAVRDGGGNGHPMAVGDGSNLRFYNTSTTTKNIVLMRMG